MQHSGDPQGEVARQIDLGLGHRYRLDGLLARSTCGDVWQATWEQTGRQVTLKTLRAGLSDEDHGYFSEALTTEADHLRRLSHPHIVRFQRAGQWQGNPVLVMEQLDQSLTEWLKEHAGPQGLSVVPEAQALAWGRQLAGALAALHRSGRKHLDLKPANVLLTRPNARGARAIKLADFGACLPVERAQHRLVGTPGWAAPEQLQPVGTDAQGYALYATSVASDWFALGQLLHRMLYGRPDAFGEHAWLTFDRQAPAAAGHTDQPVMELDDSPTWLASANQSDARPALVEAKAVAPDGLGSATAVEAHACDAGARGPVHRLVMQLLSHDPQERLLAAERWLNQTLPYAVPRQMS